MIVYEHTYIYIYICIYVYTYVTCIYIYIYIYTQFFYFYLLEVSGEIQVRRHLPPHLIFGQHLLPPRAVGRFKFCFLFLLSHVSGSIADLTFCASVCISLSLSHSLYIFVCGLNRVPLHLAEPRSPTSRTTNSNMVCLHTSSRAGNLRRNYGNCLRKHRACGLSTS